MKKMKFIYLFLVLLFFTSCNNTDQIKDVIVPIGKNRGIDTYKLYNTQSIAVIKNGEFVGGIDDLDEYMESSVNFLVVYESTAPWAETFNTGDVSITGDKVLNDLLFKYNLSIILQFEIDDMFEGILIEPGCDNSKFIEVAKRLSLVDFVMMVEIKNSSDENT